MKYAPKSTLLPKRIVVGFSPDRRKDASGREVLFLSSARKYKDEGAFVGNKGKDKFAVPVLDLTLTNLEDAIENSATTFALPLNGAMMARNM
jgi:hypothetical protein